MNRVQQKEAMMREKRKPRRRIVWYARGGEIFRTGPFADQVSACAAMELRQGGFPVDVFVWPEEEKARA